MGLAARERRKLRRIEEGLRRDDPGLDGLLAGRPPPRRRAVLAPAAWVLAAYLVPAVLAGAGVFGHVSWLVVAGVGVCPLVPVMAWLVIRRHLAGGGVPGRRREP
jgi:hypothetical protein